jgi:hypothetical protein
MLAIKAYLEKKKIDLVRDVNIQILKKYDFIPFFFNT